MSERLVMKEAQERINQYENEKLLLKEFSGVNKPCRIKCLTCGKERYFSQFNNAISSLKNKRGVCKTCYTIPKKQKRFEQSLKSVFKDEPFEIIKYQGNTKPCEIRCLKCGHIIKNMVAKNIINYKHICKKCFPPKYEKIQKNLENFKKFIEESSQWELISDLDNIQTGKEIICKCKKCGKISYKRLDLYLKGVGCGKCQNNVKLTTDEFKQKLDEDYELLSEYKNNKTKVLLKHKTCGFVFSMIPDAYINQEQRCPRCKRIMSKGEKKIKHFLQEYQIDYEQEYPVKINNHNLRFDFYLPVQDKYIEFQGIQHYEEKHFNRDSQAFLKQVANDNLKRDFCKDKLIEIPYIDITRIQDILYEKLISSTTSA